MAGGAVTDRNLVFTRLDPFELSVEAQHALDLDHRDAEVVGDRDDAFVGDVTFDPLNRLQPLDEVRRLPADLLQKRVLLIHYPLKLLFHLFRKRAAGHGSPLPTAF